MPTNPTPFSIQTILARPNRQTPEHKNTMEPTAHTTPQVGMSSRKRSNPKSFGRSRAGQQPPASYDFDFGPLERGAEALDQAVTASLRFLLSDADESQIRAVTMLPLDDKVVEMRYLLNARRDTELHNVLVSTLGAVIFTDVARTDLTSRGRTGCCGSITEWGANLNQSALLLQKEMRKVFPGYVIRAGEMAAKPVQHAISHVKD